MDTQDRQLALSPQQSFIVQAPAGSGKTELLTQRYLALLSTVTRPEAILALTFTKKAAQEMRHRILSALEDAKLQTPINHEHQQITRNLAIRALQQDQHHQWNLLQHPQCLKVTTFDAFCLELYQSIPQKELHILPKLSDYPELCYQPAIQKWFNWCREHSEYQGALKSLLQHAQYRPKVLFQQLQQLIKTRDQWLPTLHEGCQKSKTEHLNLLRAIIESQYQLWQNCLPLPLQTQILEVVQAVLPYLETDQYAALLSWKQFYPINTQQLQALSQLLLTKDFDFRQSFNHYVGLNRKTCPPSILKTLQSQSKELLATLQLYPDFKSKLMQLSKFPNPTELEIDWQTLTAYYQLLPLLIAHLHLEFEQQECCDFIYVTQQAQMAIQDTELSLYFEAKLQHLLIDEFQDTSDAQLQVIQYLCQDWEQDLHKTLFLVGDPMQSIYRFRSAKVGIFLQVQQYGLHHLRLQSLSLKKNFRSTPELIAPLNQYFANIFPKHTHIYLGAINFQAAQAVLTSQAHSQLTAEYFNNTQEQTQKLIHIVQEAQKLKISKLAILVKNRQQLHPILAALHHHAIPFQGIDLHPIQDYPLIKDLWNLCQLLCNPHHKIAMLAFLRSPFIGLNIQELHQLCHINKQQSLFTIMQNPEHLSLFSSATQQHLQHFVHLLKQAEQGIYYKKFNDLLHQSLKKLQIDQLYPQPEEQALITQFFEAINTVSQQTNWPKPQDVHNYLSNMFVSSHQRCSLQIMTIHKSKGLEFDWIILPNMGDAPRPLKIPALHGLNSQYGNLLLTHSAQATTAPILHYFEQEQERFEHQRLAYVALTRAKSRIYLLDDKPKAQHHSLRALFPADFFTAGVLPTTITKILPTTTALAHLPRPHDHHSDIATSHKTQYLGFQNQFIAKQFGIITHQILQWICQHHPLALEDIPWTLASNHLQCFQPSHALLLSQIQHQIQKFWHCPIGSWIRQEHLQEHNEYSLLIKQGQFSQHVTLDRTFIHQHIRWIIDFKTSTDASQRHNDYIKQLNLYAAYLHQLEPQHQIRCGIYYLGNLKWHHWDYQFMASADSSQPIAQSVP